ncbi:MAG: hypothetical protein Q9205_006790, partial [Flavoplaca limonia]
RSNSRFHNDFVQRLERNYCQHEDTAKAVRDQVISGSAELHADLTNLTHTVSTGQSTLNTKLEHIRTTLSRVSVQNNHLVSSSTVTAPSEVLLAPIVRAELRRVIIPTVQQCFEKYKASSDRQLDDIWKTIDEMVQQFSSRSSDDGISSSSSSTPSRSQRHIHQDSVDLINPCDLRTSKFGAPLHQNQPKSRIYKIWSYSWIFHWTMGTLSVTISTSIKERSTSPDCSTSGFNPPQKAYRVTVTFTPAISLYLFRGLQLSVENTLDQRGYYQICPLVSTFAVVPKDAGVMLCARSNNVEGLQSLFQRGLAAPSDRDNDGRTPLMYAIQKGNADVCRFLLNEGSDTTAADRVRSGHRSTYVQRLKQLGIRFSKEPDSKSHIFWLLSHIERQEVTIKSEDLEFILQTMLGFGFDSNERFNGCSLLHIILLEADRDDTRLDVQRHNRMAIVKALLNQGADLFALTDNGDSVLDIAGAYGWTTELHEVLQQTGYDLHEVRLETFVAKYIFNNPGQAFAKSTAIDSSLIELSSIAGLSLRRAMPGDRLED